MNPASPESPREIPFNYTSADDRLAVSQLLGDEMWQRRVTGRSARLLMRFFGEVLIHKRNAYLYQELIDDRRRRRRFLRNLETDLGIVEANAGGEALVVGKANVLFDPYTLVARIVLSSAISQNADNA